MVLPLFAALVLAFLGLGKAVYYYLGVTHLAEEGARLAVVSAAKMPDGSTGPQSLAQYLCSKIKSSDTAVSNTQVGVKYDGNPQTAGIPVTVSVTTNYQLIPYFHAATIPINGGATMRLETPPNVVGPSQQPFTDKSC